MVQGPITLECLRDDLLTGLQCKAVTAGLPCSCVRVLSEGAACKHLDIRCNATSHFFRRNVYACSGTQGALAARHQGCALSRAANSTCLFSCPPKEAAGMCSCRFSSTKQSCVVSCERGCRQCCTHSCTATSALVHT